MSSPQEPLVSVVLPVYNGGKYLRESLDSILAQTYPNVEIIAIDDCSTDETPRILESYGSALRIHRQSQNRGQFASANDGIVLANGEYVAVFHADDVYDPDIVAREVDFLRSRPETGAVFCLDRLVDSEGREYGRVSLPAAVPGNRPLSFASVLNAVLEFQNVFLRTPGAMVRASVYRALGGYDTRYGVCADLEMWLRIARHYPIAVLDAHLFSYRHFHSNVTQTYHRFRVQPKIFFEIMDTCLAGGAHRFTNARSLAAYEAHRAEDRLMCAVTAYVLGDFVTMRERLRATGFRRLVASRRVQRGRLATLYVLTRALSHLPRQRLVAEAFRRRWHSR